MYYLRNRSQATKAGAFFLFGVLVIVATFLDEVQGSFVPPVLLAVGVWLLASSVYVRPSLRMDDAGLHASNWIYDIHVPWSAYRGYRSLYGLVAVTADAEIPIAAFPGSGGIVSGRQQIADRRREGDSYVSDPWVRASDKQQWVTARQARHAIDAKAKEVGSVVGAAENIHSDSVEAQVIGDPITKRLSIVGCALFTGGLACIAVAISMMAG